MHDYFMVDFSGNDFTAGTLSIVFADASLTYFESYGFEYGSSSFTVYGIQNVISANIEISLLIVILETQEKLPLQMDRLLFFKIWHSNSISNL